MRTFELHDTADIPEGYTPRLFTMDPEKHELLYGSELENGMIVLLEDSFSRVDPKNRPKDGSTETPLWSDYDERNYRVNNRWCLVTSLRHRGEIVQFIGQYSDGSQASRQFNESFCWFAMVEQD